MTLILYISALVAGLIFRRSKICTIYILSVMYILSAFNVKNADYATYQSSYQNMLGSGRTLFRYRGYTDFTYLFGSNGIDFEHYMIYFYLIMFVIMIVAIRLLTEKVNPVLSYYMIFSYGIDVVQMKSLFADVLILLAVSLLIRNEVIKAEDEMDHAAKVKRRILRRSLPYMILIYAVTIHFSALFFLACSLLFVTIKNKGKMLKRVFYISIFFSVLIYVGFLPVVMHYANVLGILGDMDYMMHWATRSTRFGFILTFVLVGLVVIAINVDRLSWDRDDTRDRVGLKYKFIADYTLTAMLALPFLVMNGHFSRLIRPYMILMYIYYVHKKKMQKIRTGELIGYLCYMGSIVYAFWIDIYPSMEGTLGALLEFNRLF